LEWSLGGPLSKLCVTPPFSIDFRCQIENQVSDYRLLGASSFMKNRIFRIAACVQFFHRFSPNLYRFIISRFVYIWIWSLVTVLEDSDLLFVGKYLAIIHFWNQNNNSWYIKQFDFKLWLITWKALISATRRTISFIWKSLIWNFWIPTLVNIWNIFRLIIFWKST
jgi:hypothetical protein